MFLLLLVASVPVVGIASANAILGYESELASGRRTATILGDVAAARHGATIDTLQQTLTGLARRPGLLAASAAGCLPVVRALLSLYSDRYANFSVLNDEGRLLCSAQPAPAGRSLQQEDYFQRAVAERKFVLTPFRRDMAGESVITGAVPLIADGAVRGVVAGSLLLDHFVRDEARSQERAAQRTWLVDRGGVPLPLTKAASLDLPPPAVLQRLIQQPGAVTLEARAQGGAEFAYASTPLAPGLRLLVGLPTGEIRSAANAVLLRRAFELATFLLACLVVIVLGADLAIARPLRLLAARVRQWRPGAPFRSQPLQGEPDEVRSLERAVADAAQAISAREEELRNALRQRDLLMAEIHHRVKNNLQIVASLLNLQAGRLRDARAKAEFITARDRVQALATLHRHLYTNQTFEMIALRPFLEELGQQLFAALGERPGQRIALVVEADDLEIVTDQAVSLALLVTETVTNAIKHGFPDARSGTVTVTVHAEGEGVTLTVRDDGLGMKLDDEEAGQGIGLTLIRGFAQHLGGEIEIRGEGGTELVLRFTLRRREAEPANTEHMAANDGAAG
ncbi:histidine kinase dimerization/phosphoacceptor domain -containing protein [Roseomonas sp. E05]|uniref:sensor histidine kinase n=1 Tax=Roseomonas sp. E05 TaxID=3046310 RepID=UPI0024B89385|nr:histidine kinase dimerization/phosphoacceptor domain -containing protein [Roseomonas sp. E05]MDJ0390174.1 histidine kinase dimerization/phosphoacceptor domain -containing protein [Roseomonas sp. E05]